MWILIFVVLLGTVEAIDPKLKYTPGPPLIDETDRWSKCLFDLIRFLNLFLQVGPQI